MSITKNIQYGKNEGVTLAEFGSGDIMVGWGYSHERKSVCVMLRNSTVGAHPIGTEHDEGLKTSDDAPLDNVLEFTNAESIDVLIDALQDAKKHMIVSYVPRPLRKA